MRKWFFYGEYWGSREPRPKAREAAAKFFFVKTAHLKFLEWEGRGNQDRGLMGQKNPLSSGNSPSFTPVIYGIIICATKKSVK